MYRIKRYKLLPALALLLLSGLLCCCSDEHEAHSAQAGKEKLVSFSVKVPGSGSPKTYALDESDENEVTTVAILLFDGNGQYTYQPVYSSRVTADPDHPGDSNKKAFTAKIPEGTYKHMVILANAGVIVSNALSSISQGDSKEDLLKKLVHIHPGKWNNNPASQDYMHIPMWGEIDNITVNNSLSGNIPVSLVRMISKIDVSLAAAAQEKFRLKSVRLYNYNDRGQLVPDAADWDPVQRIATQASVPPGAVRPSLPAQSPIVYDGTAITTPDVACTGQIYTFEAKAGTSSTLPANTCLVVGGSYEGGAETFYRIDFAAESGASTYLALLRNHHYKVNIVDVGGPGLGSAEDAFNSVPANIKVAILPWSDGHFTDFVIVGQYLLGVSQGKFNFSYEQRNASSEDNILSVITDYSQGWKIIKIADDEGLPVAWLRVDKISGNTPEGDDVRLLLDANDTGTKRTAYIYVAADTERLVYKVKVDQTVFTGVDIRITDTESNDLDMLEFNANRDVQPDAQTFRLEWTPSGSDLYVTVSNIANRGFTFAPGSDIIVRDRIADPAGAKEFTIQPPAITTADLLDDPFFERNSTVLYSISDGIHISNKILTLRQFVYNLTADPKTYYSLTGDTYRFFVKSNTQFRIKSVEETITRGSEPTLLDLKATDNLRAGTLFAGNDINPGTEIRFTTKNRASDDASRIKVVFESTANPARFGDVTVEFALLPQYYPEPHKGWAGSNIYWDGTKMTFEDTPQTNTYWKDTYWRHQGLFFQWGSLWGISPVGGWSGSVILYSPDGTSGRADSYGYGTWASWPQIGNGAITSYPPVGKTIRDRHYLYEIHGQTTGIGDICKHLTEKGWAPAGKRWRLPTSQEYGEIHDYSNNMASGRLTSDNAAGKFEITGAWKKKPGETTDTPFFPASGNRDYNTGHGYSDPGFNGSYWSASPERTYVYGLNFNIMRIDPVPGQPRSQARPVRCVQE